MIRANTNENGFLLCPQCGKKTKTKANPETVMIGFPLYCGWCKQATVIEYRQSQEPERPEE